MSVTIEEVTRIAALARLRLATAEAESMARDMNTILEHMEALASADTEAPEEKPEPADTRPPPERDERSDPLSRPPGSFAPDWRDGFFVVPRIPAVEGRTDEGETPMAPRGENGQSGDSHTTPGGAG